MLPKMAVTVVETYKDVYPELEAALPDVTRIIEAEERRYARMMAVGGQVLERRIQDLKQYHQQMQGFMLLELETLTGHIYIAPEEKEFVRGYIEKRAKWRAANAGLCCCELCTEMTKPDHAAYLAPMVELLKGAPQP